MPFDSLIKKPRNTDNKTTNAFTYAQQQQQRILSLHLKKRLNIATTILSRFRIGLDDNDCGLQCWDTKTYSIVKILLWLEYEWIYVSCALVLVNSCSKSFFLRDHGQNTIFLRNTRTANFPWQCRVLDQRTSNSRLSVSYLSTKIRNGQQPIK